MPSLETRQRFRRQIRPTVNGSGSAERQTQLFAKAILRMGVPVRPAQHLSLEHPGPARPGTRCASSESPAISAARGGVDLNGSR